MEVIYDEYKVIYIQEEEKVKFAGEIRLRTTKDYLEIYDLLQKAFDESDSGLTLDLTELNFLNSSGVITISRFILSARKVRASLKKITCLGSSQISWQKKTLPNFLKIWSDLKLEIY